MPRFVRFGLAACLFVHAWLAYKSVGVSGFSAYSDVVPPFYGWQTEALVRGQLELPVAPHPELARLADPYDGNQNRPYRILDLTYFRERYYLYFGLGPVFSLLLPWRLLTGTYLSDGAFVVVASTLTCAVGLAWITLLRRRFFPTAGLLITVGAGAVVALGNLHLVHAQSPAMYQVAQICAYGWLQVALYAVLAAERARRPGFWLLTASCATGLMILARPSFLPAAGLLVVPLWSAYWRGGRQQVALWWAAICGPVTACGLIALGHNWLRFGNFLEFGNRFQLADIDQRALAMVSGDFFWRNTKMMLFTPPQFGSYFPFVYAELAPIGVLWALPFAWMAVGVVFASRGMRSAALTVVIACAGVYGPVSCYYLGWARYQIDFCGPLMLAATMGWFVLWQGAGRARLMVTLLGFGLAFVTVMMALLYTARIAPEPERLRSVARWANLPVSWWERWRGVAFGPVRLRVKFPVAAVNRAAPLLVTGWQGRDLVSVRRVDDRHVVFGFFHSGAGGPVSRPVAVLPGATHEIEIAMGSLLPTAEHPYFLGWDEAQRTTALRELRVTLDGRVVLRADARFYESRRTDVVVGRNGGLDDEAAGRFDSSGEITPLGRVQWVPLPGNEDWPRTGGPIVLSVVFSQNMAERVEPLLATGRKGAGDLVFVRYTGNARVRFGWVHSGGGEVVSQIVKVTPGMHELEVRMPSMMGESEGDLVLRLDGRVLISQKVNQHPIVAGEVAYGLNAVEIGSSAVVFSGTVFEVKKAVDAPAKIENETRFGAVEMAVLFDRAYPPGGADPLVVTGVTGAGDLVVVQWLSDGQVRFGADHWGVGAAWGEAVDLRPGSEYLIRVETGALWGPGATAAQRDRVRVTLNGRVVLDARQASHPASVEQVHVGRNPIGGSSAGLEFRGEVLSVSRVP